MNKITEVKIERGIPTLYVDWQPFQAFAGEVHNSAAYDPDRMEAEIWMKMDQSNLNTLIVPVYWETLEPEEGRYDFSLVDSLLEQAARYDKKLILLWFGLWKNAESAYVPTWMKQDGETFFRAEMYGGEKLNTISPLCREAVERDAAAFSRLMEHLREADKNSSVIMVQVENEVGLLGTERDYCQQAEEAFAGYVPDKLMDAAVKSGKIHTEETVLPEKEDWTAVFGEDAGEIFTAWYFASALEKIASVGRAEYPLPCYANVWLKQFPWYAGTYPSGGPVEDMLWVWKAAAPSLFTIAPDIYVPYVPEIMEKYTRPDNPLVIPKEVTEALNIDPLSFDMTGTKETLGEVYRLLGEIRPLYLKYRGTTHLKCFLKKSEGEQGCYLKFKSYDMEIQYLPQQTGMPAAAGAVFELDENNFLIVGMMCSVSVRTKPGDHRKADFIRKEAGTYRDGQWRCRQRQNGDEKIVTMLYDMPGCVKIKMFKY